MLVRQRANKRYFKTQKPKRKHVTATSSALNYCILCSGNGHHKRWYATKISYRTQTNSRNWLCTLLRIPRSGGEVYTLCIYMSFGEMIIVMFSFLCSSVKVYLLLYHIPEYVFLCCITFLSFDQCIWCRYWRHSKRERETN